MTETFNAKSLGKLVARALGLQPGDDVEIARDRLNPNRLLVVRHAETEAPGAQVEGT
jgi:hypothetical protein